MRNERAVGCRRAERKAREAEAREKRRREREEKKRIEEVEKRRQQQAKQQQAEADFKAAVGETGETDAEVAPISAPTVPPAMESVQVINDQNSPAATDEKGKWQLDVEWRRDEKGATEPVVTQAVVPRSPPPAKKRFTFKARSKFSAGAGAGRQVSTNTKTGKLEKAKKVEVPPKNTMKGIFKAVQQPSTSTTMSS